MQGWADEVTPWVRMPQQDRARRSLERALDAGARLLAEHGYEGFSISEVCRLADVSPGALYGRVEGKRALFLAIHAAQMHRITRSGSDLFAGSPKWSALSTPDLVRQTVRTLGGHYLDERGLLRAFILRGAVDPPVAATGEQMSQRIEASVIDLLMTRAEEYPHDEPRRAAQTAYRTASDSLAWRTAFGWDFGSSAGGDPHEWIEQLSEVCCAFLLHRPSRPSAEK